MIILSLWVLVYNNTNKMVTRTNNHAMATIY